MALFPASGGGSNSYSTTEKAVGTDVDGSIIYEKTWYSDNVNLTTSTVIDASFTSTSIKRLLGAEGGFKIDLGSSGYALFPILDSTNAGVRYTTALSVLSSGLQLTINNRTVLAYHITLKYTKS